jgi:hypothetical protein
MSFGHESGAGNPRRNYRGINIRGQQRLHRESIRDKNTELQVRLRAAYVRARQWYTRAIYQRPSTFGNKRSHHDGGESYCGARYASAWKRTADFLMDHGCLDPERYIRAQFVFAGRRLIPMPNQRYSKHAWQRYEDFLRDADEELAQALKTEARAFELACAEYAERYPQKPANEIWRLVLTDVSKPISSLLRYAVAVTEKFDDIASQLEEDALAQLLEDPGAYERCWSETIPEVLITRSKDLLAQL